MQEYETAIEDRVTDWAEANDWIVEKVKFANAGYPDRIYFGYGMAVLIEYKRPKKKPDKLQEYRLRELAKRGIKCTWVNTSSAGIAFLKACMGSARVPAARN